MALNDDIFNRVSEIYSQMGNTVEANAQIAREAQAAGLNPSQLSSALNVPETEISRLASEAGVPFTPPASTPPISSPDFSGLAPLANLDLSGLGTSTTPNNNVTIGGGGQSATVGSGTSGITVGTTGQQTPGVTTGVSASPPPPPAIPPAPTATSLTAEQQKNIRDYAQASANTFEAGVSPEEIQRQYTQDLLALPEYARAEAEKIFAEELETNRPGVLEQFRQAVSTPPPPPVEIPNVQDVTVTDSSGNPVTYQFGSEVNDAIANAWVEGTQTGDYSKVQQLLVNAGYSIDDVQKQFGLDADAMAAIKNAGVTGAEPEDSVITGLYEDITTLLENNQNAQKEIDTLNQVLAGLNLTIEDLRNNYALSQDDVDYIQSIGISGYNPLAGNMPTTETEIYERMTSPQLPESGKVVAQGIATDPSQFIGTDSGIGQVQTMRQATGVSQPGVTTAGAPTQMATSTMQATQTSADIANALQDVNPAAGSVSENAQMQAITQSPTSTDVGTVGPAQLTETTQVQAPQSRTLQSGEMIQSAVDREKAMAFVDQAQAATADPSAKATVQGQLADIMSQFDGGQIPAWAAGAMRTANATLASRGLGASSLAGQAVVQAAMEASLPIAIQDAATQAQFEQQNLSNRQQRAMLSAQQRAAFMQQEFDQEFQARVANAAKISDIANMNFNAEQQIALENARLAQTVELANLSNRQAMVMAETAQIAQLELSNLNNRQQAAVQNANAFLQMDMTNLSNEQQMTMFDAQSRVNAIFSDAAAENAARQFNSQSENQTNQFFQSLATQVQQFNANQLNSMEQFRVEQVNTLERFNAQLATQQDQFNAENQLVIAQSDAQWNRQIATADTAATNMANQLNAQAVMEMSNQAFANAAQILRDQMEFAFDAGQSQADRDAEIVLQLLANEGAAKVAELRSDDDGVFGNVIGRVVGKVLGF